MAQRSRALDTLLTRLNPVLGARLRTDPAALEAASGDESGFAPQIPAAVMQPASTDEVCAIAREAADLGVGLVPRGGGTGKAGACIPQATDVVVDLSGMNRILELHPADMYAVVQPGLITIELDRAVGEHGFMYPPDPGSWESCSIGGNIATNAGGPRAVKYGVTHNYVWGLEVVLPGGQVVHPGRRSLKGVAGFDVTSLLVGSEGTLGFVTAATMHFIPAPPEVETAWLTFADPLTASRVADRIFAAGITPRILEMMDRMALDTVRPVAPFRVPADSGAALLVETDGSGGNAMQQLERISEIAAELGAGDSALATSEKERQAMGRTRRLVSSALKEKYPAKLSDDIAVPRSHIPELLDRATAAGEASGLPVSAYGHLGDGNLHVNLLCRQDRRDEALALRREIVRFAVSLGGTISGEHGLGIAKRDQLALEQSALLIDMQRQLKRVFDPRGIMNPGKVLPSAP